jgi:hypothetical protein
MVCMIPLVLILDGVAIVCGVGAVCAAVWAYYLAQRCYGQVVAPVLGLCERWDGLSKGESETTRQIRAAIREGLEEDVA